MNETKDYGWVKLFLEIYIKSHKNVQHFWPDFHLWDFTLGKTKASKENKTTQYLERCSTASFLYRKKVKVIRCPTVEWLGSYGSSTDKTLG